MQGTEAWGSAPLWATESPEEWFAWMRDEQARALKKDRPIPPGQKAAKGVHIDLFKLDLCGTCKAPLRDVQTVFIRQGHGYCKASCRPKLQIVAR